MSAYNAEQFIEDSIKSVLNQSYSNFEFIICDDGSTDNTGEIIKAYPSIKYIYQQNCGQGAGRNNAVKQAKGEYLAFIDSDDCWLPEKLDIQISLFKKSPSLGAVYSDMEIVDINKRSLGFNARGKMKRGNIFNYLLSGNYMVGLSSLIVKAEIFNKVGGFSNHRYCQDFVLLLKIAYKNNIDFSEESLVYYLSHENNISKKIDVSYPEQISFYNEIPNLYDLDVCQRSIIRTQLKRLYFSYAILHFRQRNFTKVSSILKEAKTLDLLFWKSVILTLLNNPLIRNLIFDKI